MTDKPRSERLLMPVAGEQDRTVTVVSRDQTASGSHLARHTSRIDAEVTGWKDTVMAQAVLPRPAACYREDSRDRWAAGADVEGGERRASTADEPSGPGLAVTKIVPGRSFPTDRR